MESNAKTRNHDTDTDADMEPDSGDAAFRANEVAAFTSRVCLTFTHYRRRLVDPDGLCVKAVIDGLVACGVLANDSSKQIAEVRHRQIKSDGEKTVVVIEEVELS